MTNIPIKFASDSGLSAFNINLKDFVFQLITFVIVLLILRKWVVPKVVQTMNERQATLEKSLKQAKQTEEVLAAAEKKAEDILAMARAQADTALSEAKKTATGVISTAEEAAAKRASLIIKEAEEHLSQERDKLRKELRAELADLVADATEKIIEAKLDAKADMSLIERAIKAVAG